MTLTCPGSGNNMAAIAKQLHATALEAEADISAIEILMRSAVNLPTVVLTSTANLTGLSQNADLDVGLQITWATTFDNTDGGGGSASGAFGPQNVNSFVNTLGEGLYEVGFFCTLVASGAVTDNTVRLFWIDHRRPDPTATGGEAIIQRSGYTLFESNTGVGVEAAFAGHFRARPGDRFAFYIFHLNAGSTLTLNSGAIIWATKLSESTLTQVV